jgi:hypothetical protein
MLLANAHLGLFPRKIRQQGREAAEVRNGRANLGSTIHLKGVFITKLDTGKTLIVCLSLSVICL